MQWAKEHIRLDVCRLDWKLAFTTDSQVESSKTNMAYGWRSKCQSQNRSTIGPLCQITTRCPKEIWTSLKKHGSTLNTIRSWNYILLDRKNRKLDIDWHLLYKNRSKIDEIVKSQSKICARFGNQNLKIFVFPKFAQ